MNQFSQRKKNGQNFHFQSIQADMLPWWCWPLPSKRNKFYWNLQNSKSKLFRYDCQHQKANGSSNEVQIVSVSFLNHSMAWTNIYLNDSMAMMQATKKKKRTKTFKMFSFLCFSFENKLTVNIWYSWVDFSFDEYFIMCESIKCVFFSHSFSQSSSYEGLSSTGYFFTEKENIHICIVISF